MQCPINDHLANALTMAAAGSILIIDDNRADGLEFERVLRGEGYTVETALTFESGLAPGRTGKL